MLRAGCRLLLGPAAIVGMAGGPLCASPVSIPPREQEGPMVTGLEQVARWRTGLEDGMCRTTGLASNGTEIVQLVRLPGGPQASLRLAAPTMLDGRGFRPARARAGDADLLSSLAPGGWLWGERSAVLLRFGARADIEPLRGATKLEFEDESGAKLSVPLTGFRDAMSGWDACEAGVLRSWGIPPAEMLSMRKQPGGVRPLASYIGYLDYPTKAFKEGRQGNSTARLEIAPDGSLRSCSTVVSSGSPDLDERVCDVFRTRARFVPGEGADGQPARGWIVTRVAWRLPE